MNGIKNKSMRIKNSKSSSHQQKRSIVKEKKKSFPEFSYSVHLWNGISSNKSVYLIIVMIKIKIKC